MTMTFSLHDSFQPNLSHHIPSDYGHDDEHRGDNVLIHSDFHILREKLQIPVINDNFQRPRLTRLLASSRSRFPATLITGRAGTGKTALAVALAQKTKNVGWYTVEATDADWSVFSRYFSESLKNAGIADSSVAAGTSLGRVSPGDVALFLLRHFFQTESSKASSPLIVLDDIHHIFDAEWFEEFFSLLICSLPRDAHLLMLCRSKPPAPLWRLRSKQILNVLDEKEIAFDAAETKGLFRFLGRSDADADYARQKSFGRISKLLELAR